MTEIVRRLDGIEAVMAHLHASLRGTAQVTTVLTLEGEVPAEQAEAAFRRLFATYETLRLQIVEEDGGFLFVRGGGLPAGSVQVCTTSIDAWVEHEINDILIPSKELWRYRLLHDDDRTHIVFTRHHAISDGFTTERLLADILRDLDGGRASRSAAPSIPHTPGLAALTASPSTLRQDSAGGEDPDLLLPHLVTAPLEMRSTGVVSRVVSAAALASLTERCRATNVTVHAAIATAFATAFAEARGHDRSDLFTAVSRRGGPTARESIDDVGCFIGVVRSRIGTRESPINTAHAYAADLRRASALLVSEARSPEQIRNSIEALKTTDHHRGLAITNLGSLRALRAATARRILDFRSLANRTGGLFALALHVTFLGDVARLTFTFPRPLTPNGFVDEVLDATFDRLELAA